MIILDTNVVSEAMRPEPNSNVRAWLDEQEAETLYLTSVTIAEILFGIAILPEGRRRQRLSHTFEGLLPFFGDRVLPFDVEAARRYADLARKARLAGRAFAIADGYIAAIASLRGFIIVSRDVEPYAAGGLHVVDPWRG